MSIIGRQIFGSLRAGAPRRAGALALIIAGAAATLAGCAHSQPASSESPVPVPVATVAATRAPGQAPKALPAMTTVQHASVAMDTIGRLGYRDGCFFLVSLTSGHRQTAVVWPYGFTARANPIGIYNPEGKLVDRPGEWVSLGGGEESLARVRPGTIANMACLAGAKTAVLMG